MIRAGPCGVATSTGSASAGRPARAGPSAWSRRVRPGEQVQLQRLGHVTRGQRLSSSGPLLRTLFTATPIGRISSSAISSGAGGTSSADTAGVGAGHVRIEPGVPGGGGSTNGIRSCTWASGPTAAVVSTVAVTSPSGYSLSGSSLGFQYSHSPAMASELPSA